MNKTLCGIYKIENIITGKVYIGQSSNIYKRWNEHKNRAFNPKDKDYESHLYRAIRKYGLENFTFVILESCDKESLNAREMHWIKEYDSYYNGYNQTVGGDYNAPANGKNAVNSIIQDLEQTNLLQREIAAKHNISEKMVQGINTGRYWHDSNIDYPIRKTVKLQIQTCVDCGKPICRGATRCKNCENINRKTNKVITAPVSKDELETLIKTMSFVKIATLYGVSSKTVRKWCKRLNLPYKRKDIKEKYNILTKEEQLYASRSRRTTYSGIPITAHNTKTGITYEFNDIDELISYLRSNYTKASYDSVRTIISKVLKGERRTCYSFSLELKTR